MAMFFGKVLGITASGTEVQRSHVYGGGREFRITASKYGVSFSESPVISEGADLQRMARAIGDAFKDYRSLRRTGKPHEEPELADPIGGEGAEGHDAGVDRASELAEQPNDQAIGSETSDAGVSETPG